MFPTTANFKHAFRKNMVLLLATLGLMVSLSLVIYYSDQNFRVEKKNYIIENIGFSSELYQFDVDQIKGTLQTLSGNKLEEYIVKVQKDFQIIVDNPQSIIYKIELKSDTKHTLITAQNVEKLKTMNNFSNSLFSKNFSEYSKRPFDLAQPDSGGIVMFYTSPSNNSNIENIVMKYRWRVYPILFLLFSLYIASLRWFILPFRRVIDKLEGIKEKFASNIDNPRTLIETAYNQMARNTNLLHINLRMIDLVATNPTLNLDQILVKSLEMVREIIPRSYLIHLQENSGKEIIELIKTQNDPMDSKGVIEIEKQNTLIGLELNKKIAKIGNEPAVLERIETIAKDSWYLAVLQNDVKFPDAVENGNPLATLAQQIRLVIQSKELQRRFVEQEKSQVSIHLARNLGHDVTNIIASIRWDLDTLQTVFQNQSGSLDSTMAEKSQHAVAEALEGLGHGTQLLQEIVDVYRSFMYLEKPVFEKVSLEQPIVRLVELFRRATTQRIEIQTHFASNLPDIMMEPRLFKLAIFNLLTNSLDAIKKASIDHPISGLIELGVNLDNTQKNLLVSVKDNGPGLRSSDGSPLPKNETQRIFQFGYSTKEKSTGGLGLAWVYTIICEIHKGTITAENHSSGGVEFTISIPITQ